MNQHPTEERSWRGDLRDGLPVLRRVVCLTNRGPCVARKAVDGGEVTDVLLEMLDHIVDVDLQLIRGVELQRVVDGQPVSVVVAGKLQASPDLRRRGYVRGGVRGAHHVGVNGFPEAPA